MKKILSIGFILMMVATNVMAGHVISSKDNPEFLFVLSAKSGTFKDGKLTLKDVPLVVYFSDRPNRIAGHMSLKKFVELWGKGPNSYKADPPNATLSIFDDDGDNNVVIELIGTPDISGDSVIFQVKTLLGDLPEEFFASSLLIDLSIRNPWGRREW